jgi:hypothetical protein
MRGGRQEKEEGCSQVTERVTWQAHGKQRNRITRGLNDSMSVTIKFLCD